VEHSSASESEAIAYLGLIYQLNRDDAYTRERNEIHSEFSKVTVSWLSVSMDLGSYRSTVPIELPREAQAGAYST